MSARRRKANPCPTATKTAFGDEAAALAALEAIRHEHSRAPVADHIPVRAYRCSCARWHLTSKALSYAVVAQRLDAGANV